MAEKTFRLMTRRISQWYHNNKIQALVGLGALVVAIAGLTALIFVTHPIPSPSSHSTPATAQIVTPSSLKSSFKAPLALAQEGKYEKALIDNHFLIIDVRPRAEYLQSHIKGAVSSPLDQLHFALFSDGTKLVVYTDSTDQASQAMEILGKMGITAAYTLTSSLADLKAAGYTLEP